MHQRHPFCDLNTTLNDVKDLITSFIKETIKTKKKIFIFEHSLPIFSQSKIQFMSSHYRMQYFSFIDLLKCSE